jgi:hypothetical protein
LTLGSFPQYNFPSPNENNSVLSASVPNTVVPFKRALSRSATGLLTNASRNDLRPLTAEEDEQQQQQEEDEENDGLNTRSKLRSLIDKLKKDKKSTSIFMTESKSMNSSWEKVSLSSLKGYKG